MQRFINTVLVYSKMLTAFPSYWFFFMILYYEFCFKVCLSIQHSWCICASFCNQFIKIKRGGESGKSILGSFSVGVGARGHRSQRLLRKLRFGSCILFPGLWLVNSLSFWLWSPKYKANQALFNREQFQLYKIVFNLYLLLCTSLRPT